jgi:hypothetical protein
MKLECGYWRRELARHAAQDRSLPDGSRLARHVARCEPCRAVWEGLRSLTEELKGTLEVPGVSDSFTEGLWARVAAASVSGIGRRATPARPSGWAAPVRILPIGAVLLAAVLLTFPGHRLARNDTGRSNGLPGTPIVRTDRREETKRPGDRVQKQLVSPGAGLRPAPTPRPTPPHTAGGGGRTTRGQNQKKSGGGSPPHLRGGWGPGGGGRPCAQLWR